MKDLKKVRGMKNAPSLILIGPALLIVLLCFSMISCSTQDATIPTSDGVPDVPVKGMVTMVDVGAHECIPCKMMAPVLEEVEKEYAGKAAVIFIDVWKHREQGARFGVRSIPTQIFYNKNGKEVYRHEGFMDKKSIVAVLRKLGV